MVWEQDPHKPQLHGDAAMPGKVILVGGGARSGKSRFALAYAEALGGRCVFVATARAYDDEMAARIAHHRDERHAGWVTIEEPLALPETLARVDADVVLVDCLTLWLSNLLLQGDAIADVEAAVERLVQAASAHQGHVVLVTNEVGMGIVPEHALGRLFRDVAGRAHQRLAAVADEVYMAMMGLIVRLRPGPLVAFPPDGQPGGAP
jgi:adenosylcobinamide kinase / adenosylcobinamide-phosphate guanylyltransferase